MQFPDAERRELLGYAAAPTLDRNAVARYALGERGLADAILAPFRPARFERIWSDLVALAEPALAVEVQSGTPTGRCKLGGLPDLPVGVDWPRRREKPLAFVGQLELAEVHQHLHDPTVPSRGLLSFFYEADLWTSGSSPADRGAWHVWLSDGPLSRQSPPALAPPAVPDDYDPATWSFEEAGVVFVPRLSLPERDHRLMERFDMGSSDDEAYMALMDELRRAHGLTGLTQFLGYPAEIQNDPFKTSQLASNGVGPEAYESQPREVTRLLEARGAWRSLFQVDSIDEIRMLWADSGLLHYCMRDEDLRAGRWENSWLLMQSL
jgi:uncharacterized protein YwqG